MSQVPLIERAKKQITRNLMQLMVRMAMQRIIVICAGRGSGKSTVIADKIIDVVHDMPRSSNFIQGVTFQQILTRTLPSTIESLESLGYKQGLHFFVGRKPPEAWRWEKAYQPPLDYTKAISWYNGSVYLLFSQDVSSRGPNTASGLGDELALLNPQKLQSEAIATLRQKPSLYSKCRTYLSQLYATSHARTQVGRFIYNYEEEAKKNPENVLFISASSYINKDNLPAQWFEDQRRSMSKYEFDIEIRNIRPKAMKGGFYPLFNENMHTYTAYNNDYLSGLMDDGYDATKFKELDCRQDADLSPNHELDIALDYGKFNCIVTGQETLSMFRHLSGFSVESPKLTVDLVNDWCRYYRFHRTKTVHYWYDQTATGRDGRSPKTYAEIVIDTLEANGWNVITHYYGKAADHVDKYNFWNVALLNNHSQLPHFSWNKHNCKYVIESITNAEAREGANGIEKIKTDEKNDALDQRYTTHYSDCNDMLVYFKYAANIKEGLLWLPTAFVGNSNARTNRN